MMDINLILVIAYLLTFVLLLFTGYPVGFILGGTAVLYALIGEIMNFAGFMVDIDLSFLSYVPSRLFVQLVNVNLIAVPMFIFMGIMLEKSKVTETLLETMQLILRRVPGGLAISVTIIGIVLAASTGISSASLVLLGTMALTPMLNANYKKEFAMGTICASGTLGILIPPSVMLIIMADQMTISVPQLFMGALFPGLMLGSLYLLYIIIYAIARPQNVPMASVINTDKISFVSLAARLFRDLIPPVILIGAVLGSIFFGIATAAEASGVGAFGAILLSAAKKRMNLNILRDVCHDTARITAFIFILLFAAPCFALVLRGLGGDEVIGNLFASVATTKMGLLAFVLVLIFLLGFILDWIEITIILIPLVLPVIEMFSIDPYWFAILVAVCLQTSFLTPPIGPSIFIVQGVAAPKGIELTHIYKGVIPFVIIQLIGVSLLLLYPELVSWLPTYLDQ